MWLQASYDYTYHYAYRPNVSVVRTTGGYLLSVDGVDRSVYVTPVEQFTKTCIASDFEGWTGDAVFEMCNGEVWQQVQYRYRYHYAVRPHALLYATSGGVRLQVDGMDESIRVVRLR